MQTQHALGACKNSPLMEHMNIGHAVDAFAFIYILAKSHDAGTVCLKLIGVAETLCFYLACSDTFLAMKLLLQFLDMHNFLNYDCTDNDAQPQPDCALTVSIRW